MTGLGNLLMGEDYTRAQQVGSGLGGADFVELLDQYAGQHLQPAEGWPEGAPLVSENMHPDEGWWMDRVSLYKKYHVRTNTY